MIKFEWDKRKNTLNKKKHEVDFKEAKTVFYDEFALRFDDPNHLKGEDRFIMLGMSYKLRVLVVVHCYRENDSIIRIISARKATKKEQKYYEECFK